MSDTTWVLNLYTGAWTRFKNCMFRGYINPPTETGNYPWLMLNTTVGNWVDMNSLFLEDTSFDFEDFEDDTSGPHFIMDYRRFNPGDPDRVAFWSTLQLKAYCTSPDSTGVSVMMFVDFDDTTLYDRGEEIEVDTDYDPPQKILLDKRASHMGWRLEEIDISHIIKIGPGVVSWSWLGGRRFNHV